MAKVLREEDHEDEHPTYSYIPLWMEYVPVLFTVILLHVG